jgi:hypothetical protein
MIGRTTKVLGGVALAVSLGAAGYAVSAQEEPAPQPFPASIADPAAVRLVEVKDTAGQVVLSGSFGAAVRTASGMERTAVLAATGGSATAAGSAEIEVGTASELDVDVDDLTPSTSYRLFIDEVEIAPFTTDAGGDAELEFGDDDA